MGDCRYCRKPAGFLRSKHPDCEAQYEGAKSQISDTIWQALSSANLLESLQTRIADLAQRCYISNSEQKRLVAQAWTRAVDQFLEDGVLDASEEKRLMELKERFALSQTELDAKGALTRVAKAAVIRDILNGIIPQRVKLDGSLSVNLKKGEKLVWAFPSSDYLEDKTRRQYVGGSQGVSIRVAKGLYYRVGAFKAQAVDRTERVYVDTGLVAVTDKHIYFGGPVKSLRLAYVKIVSFQPFSDGIGVIRDASNAKPQLFITGDGWFTYNLVTNLAQL